MEMNSVDAVDSTESPENLKMSKSKILSQLFAGTQRTLSFKSFMLPSEVIPICLLVWDIFNFHCPYLLP